MIFGIGATAATSSRLFFYNKVSSLIRPATVTWIALSSLSGVQCLASPFWSRTRENLRSIFHRQTSSGAGCIPRTEIPSGSLGFSTLFERRYICGGKQQRKPGSFISASIVTSSDSKMSTELSAAEKLTALRARMREEGIDVYIVPSDDPHLSEYTPEAYKRRGFLTGFHGSAGVAVVTLEQAFLWTDSRYWNEAGLCLDPSSWVLQKQGLPSTPTIAKWIAQQSINQYKSSNKALVVGIDPYVFAASFPKELETAWTETVQEDPELNENDDGEVVKIGKLVNVNSNLIDEIWTDRPALPLSPFRVHPLEYAGVTWEEKVSKVRKDLESKKSTLAVFCALDDVAYLFNVRAKGDIDTCPVGIAYASISMDEVSLYCDSAKVSSPEVQEHLKGVSIKSYSMISEDIAAHCSVSKKNRVWLDKSRANCAIANLIPSKSILDAQNSIVPMKACKNKAELEGMRRAHIVDGAAYAEFMSWLEAAVIDEGRTVSEVEIDEKLTGCRAKQPGFVEVSFPTIAGVGSNGAIIHYRAEEGSDLMKYFDKNTPILIDSGGQYTYGTTDVTRTWHFGEATSEYKEMYTRVLKGNIGLDCMVFPENTPGFVLDVFARRSLWDAGKDYGHGTGHGVGAALNVHEGPMGISPRWANKEVLKKGMVLSNEPGYYLDGKYGIRIENLLEILYVKPEYNEDNVNGDAAAAGAGATEKKFLKFAKLTMIPIQKSLIDMNLMTKEELDWLDVYHEEVLAKVGPLLEPGSPAMEWLKKSCEKSA